MNLENARIGVAGAGTMGRGIAQIAATAGHEVVVYDLEQQQIDSSRASLEKLFEKLVSKEKFTRDEAMAILGRINFETSIDALSACRFVIEAIVEKESSKQELYRAIERNSEVDSIIASNTSSLAIAALSSSLSHPQRFLGVHFFNPAPLMPLVEIVPSVLTESEVTTAVRSLVDSWGKVTVLAKDTPGFIVNRIARPFYGESLRILDEGIATAAQIDVALKQRGFRMGPFELMDLIGNDINYTVTETVWTQMYYDSRFRPSITQKRMMEAGLLGRKSGQGFYDYGDGVPTIDVQIDENLSRVISDRVIAMLINEAADAVAMNIASKEDIELAMTKGVNYPKGLLAWADELGIATVVGQLSSLHVEYGEERYRPHPLLKKMTRNNQRFLDN